MSTHLQPRALGAILGQILKSQSLEMGTQWCPCSAPKGWWFLSPLNRKLWLGEVLTSCCCGQASVWADMSGGGCREGKAREQRGRTWGLSPGGTLIHPQRPALVAEVGNGHMGLVPSSSGQEGSIGGEPSS